MMIVICDWRTNHGDGRLHILRDTKIILRLVAEDIQEQKRVLVLGLQASLYPLHGWALQDLDERP